MHQQFLLAALKQARLGRGQCAPNPAVGAVAVYNGMIIAQAYHSGAGLPHAEKKVLDLLPNDCSNITIYVTLEPCNHWGKTPPCVDALINRRVQRVIYAYRDPNPVVVENDTPKQLREHGIDVLHYPLPEIDAFYQSYTHWVRTGRPWVTVKMAQSLDGKIAGPGGARIALSNAICAEFTHQKRLHSDVILTTATTINQDDPLLNVRLYDEAICKPIAILDRQHRLNLEARIHATSMQCHVYHDERVMPKVMRSSCLFHAMPADATSLDLSAVIGHLGALGFHDVWVEAGATLCRALHQQNLVQRTYLYVVPRVLGEDGVSLYAEEDIYSSPKRVEWRTMGDNVMAVFDWSDFDYNTVFQEDA